MNENTTVKVVKGFFYNCRGNFKFTARSALYSCTVSRYLQHYRLYYWNYGKPKQNGWKNQFVQKYEGNHEKGDHVASDCRWCNH